MKYENSANGDYQEFGGWSSIISGEWLWLIIQKSFEAYWNNANAEYFEMKYATKDKEILANKLIEVATKNAALLGGATGAAMSTNEITALLTGGEGVVGLPANLVIAAASIGGEVILLMRIQLQLIANLGKLYGVRLDPNDPEDILTILAFALGGSVAEAAGKFGMKIGGKLSGEVIKGVIKKETLAALKRIASKAGVKILQKSIIKYTVPLVSIGIGSVWNYLTTKAVAEIAIKHFERRSNDGPEYHI